MGTYDTFLDPPKGEECQSKAFGKGLRTYRPGDAVTPQRAPLSKEDYDAYNAGAWNPVIPGLESITLQSRVEHATNEKYIDVAAGIYTGISSRRDMDVPLIDHYGRLIDDSAD
ncbi:hypothetical protein NE857_21665 [Nocardiopsis exhalans]|uniref:Uncharacterized protein n=1 Tax=Nocardiopsis exhalans TaxID=163604 RepID=A0ABY5D0T6_9ACTN|nr:hypothetical protein [Nocardiopsis exhalans]USY17926.1 hypothetical protein NE857_21665 [Nocardiopsis exhalans]